MASHFEHPFVVAIELDDLALRAADAINNDLFYSRSLTPKEQMALIYHLIDRWNAVCKIGHLLAVIPNPIEKSK